MAGSGKRRGSERDTFVEDAAVVFGDLAVVTRPGAPTRQPEIEAKARQYFFLTVGLVEAMYFINLLFMVVFVYVFAAKSITA